MSVLQGGELLWRRSSVMERWEKYTMTFIRTKP